MTGWAVGRVAPIFEYLGQDEGEWQRSGGRSCAPL